MVLPGAHTSSEQCLRHSLSLCRALEKQNGYSTSPSQPKPDAESDQQDLKVLLQNRAGAQHATNKHRLIHLHTHQYTHPHAHPHAHPCTHTHMHTSHTPARTPVYTPARAHTRHTIILRRTWNLHQRAPPQGFPALWNQETCSKNTQCHE